LFLLFGGIDFVAILRLFLTRTRVRFAADTKWARYLGASDDSLDGHFVVDFFVALAGAMTRSKRDRADERG
jgi:hypothetical protein